MLRQAIILLALTCVLAHISVVHAECCRASLTMSYGVDGGSCGDVGGHSGRNGCTITVCADGRAQVGTFCGKGPCDIIGCKCRNGCLTGNWKQSFIDNNRGHRIHVTGEHWNT